VLSLVEKGEVHVGVWDITSDIGIPAYACVIMDQPDSAAWRVHGAYSGFGCHLAPEIGLLRALTEAVQSRLTFIAGSRDDMFRRDYTSIQLDEPQRIRWRELCQPVEVCSFSRHSSLASDTFEGDISIILDRLHEVGVKSAVVTDLTNSDYAIPVVKVMVPSLEESGGDNRPGERIKKMS
jgi:YcaO-like protein with predicted kinase domain